MLTGAEPIRGVAKVLVGTPRRWGQVARHAWGFEHPFPRLSDREATGRPDEPRQPWIPPWTFDGAETLPALRAVAIAGTQFRTDNWPSGCPNESELLDLFDLSGNTRYWRTLSGEWGPDIPTGYGATIWLRNAATSSATVHRIETNQPWHAEPTLDWLVWRWAPLVDASRRPYVSLRIGGPDGVLIVLPITAPGAISTDEYLGTGRPQVLRLSGGVAAYVLAEWDQAGARQAAANATPQMSVVSWRSVEPGTYLVALGGTDGEALILDPTLTLPEAPLQVTAAGACEFTVWPHVFALGGSARKAVPGQWPLWTNARDGALVLRTYAPEGTTVTTDLHEEDLDSEDPDDPPTTQPEIILETTDEHRTPVVYMVAETHPPTALDEEPNLVDLSSWWERAEIEEDKDGRASLARLYPNASPDVDLAALRGNEWTEITLAQQWPEQSLTDDLAQGARVLSGFLEVTTRGREGSVLKGAPRCNATVYTWFRRFGPTDEPRKYMARFAGVSFAGRPLREAATLILTSCGVPESLISFTLPDEDLLDDLVLPCARPWERRFAYAFETSVVTALDEMAAACGCRMRQTREGKLDFFMPLPWNGIVDGTITDGSCSVHDMVESIEATFDVGARRNVALHIGASKSGETVTGLVSDWESLFDPRSSDFLGDDWWVVREDPAIDDPEVTAYVELERRRRYRASVQWTWAGHPSLEPGMHLAIDVSGINLPAGTRVEVLRKSSLVDGPTPLYTETVTAGIAGVAA